MPKFNRFDLLPLIMSVLIGLWLAVPSSVFLKTVSLQVNDDIVVFVRETPFGAVTAKWEVEITLVGRGTFECRNSGQSFYQVETDNLVTYRLGDWAKDCIDAGPPYIIRWARQVMLFDVIPLRKTRDAVAVNLPEIESPPEIESSNP